MQKYDIGAQTFYQELPMLFNGLLEFNIAQIVLYTLALTHITIVSVTVYLHRYSAHRALDLHPILSHFFRFWLWLTTSMSTKEWTAVHRKHHAKCETEEDPHSPVVLGLGKVLREGAELYQTAADDKELVQRYGKGTPEDWLENYVYSNPKLKISLWGVSLMLIINLLLLGPIGLTVWAVQMIWIPLFAAGVINGIGHYFGYRNYECKDAATNISPWGILIGGEELHNNHHTFPNSAKLSSKWYEFDLGWFYIKVFEALGLASNIKQGPVAHKIKDKKWIDLDTARALANDRFQVMASFKAKVIDPTVNKELRKMDIAQRRLFKRAKSLISTEESLLKTNQMRQLNHVLDNNQMMKQLYLMKNKLLEIWQNRSSGADEMLKSLKDWIAEAEASGIHALEDFAAHLKAYSTQPAMASTSS